ncbi:carboxylesterase [Inquilinus limosus MP06]|uniref:Carboxylesterase n=2 Tax=Inquilinus limosus TaxID=171674 RepID=A0A0A0D319_9PROT|nr:carboxylesterase [Inquilinus limosus MP06]
MASAASAQTAMPVTVETYDRAQTDVYFAGVAKAGGFGRFKHGRELSPPAQQGIVRGNRDTLYSFAILDLDAGPATVTLPDAGRRYMGMQVVNQDQYTRATFYDAGSHTLTREAIGTRYAIVVVRFLVDFASPDDVARVHALQDKVTLAQDRPGSFAVPDWDLASLGTIRAALQQLGTTVTDTRRMFGAGPAEVDPVRHLIGTALLWGGNPEKDGLYLPITPARNDGATVYRLTVGEVPVDGFWSLTVYNSAGYLQPNPRHAYAVNSLTAKAGADGMVTIQFGGCDDAAAVNCLPITPGWNYTVRLFRPRAEILDGTWQFPLARPVG